ncbi:MAG: hypothetical protein LBV11_07225 [Bacillus cereus]|jgi:hypothetical protein|nr:hypothetical protein [Bacillus cereus]
MLSEKFKNSLSLLGVLEEVKTTHDFRIDIHGYERQKYYPEFRLPWAEKMRFYNLLFIDEVEHAPRYGFFVGEDQYNDESELISGQNSSGLTIESITIEPFNYYINYNFVINGKPEDIAVIADENRFFVELTVTGCLNTVPFWKQSLYLSYLMFKGNNILSSFMHLFITFEGLIRYHTSNTTTSNIHRVYQNYTNQSLPDYLNAYRKIRNQVMHGNENIASKLTIEDLEILLDTIDSLEENRTSVILTENTQAIDEGLRLN